MPGPDVFGESRLIGPGTGTSPTFVECVPKVEPDDAAVCPDRLFVDAPWGGGGGCGSW